MKKFLASLCLCLLVPFTLYAAEPDFLDKAQLARLVEQNKGKVIMLNFFATWCPPCRVELPELVKLREAYPENRFMLIGLSVDENLAAVGPFIESAGVNYPVFMAAKDITDSMNISSVPHNTFFTKDGEMVISEPGIADLKILRQVVDDLLKGK